MERGTRQTDRQENCIHVLESEDIGLHTLTRQLDDNMNVGWVPWFLD